MEKYYNGAVEQLLAGLGKTPDNSILVRYGGEFSIRDLEIVAREEKRSDIYLTAHEFSAGEIGEGYEPYVSIVCEMFRRHMSGSFAEFLEKCGVYYMHRQVFLSYFRTGVCKRKGQVLLDEVEYEQERMADAIEEMLVRLAEVCPIAILLNNFQFAPRSTMILTSRLILRKDKNIALLLGVNDTLAMPEFIMTEWEKIYEKLDNGSRVYHIGNSAEKKGRDFESENSEYVSEEVYEKLNNLVTLLDFEQASYLLKNVERRIKFDNLEVMDEMKYRMLRLLAQVSILTRDISKALEVCEDLEKIRLVGRETECRFEHDYLVATAYMYQGKLKEALSYDKKAYEAAERMENEYDIFLAELLEAQIQMSGWYNIFFCAQDVKISGGLIEKLKKYKFWNHLAYIYIYAYDNQPEVVAQANRSEELLVYFSKGIYIAKKIGNEQLLTTAYQKNIMLAATNGMHNISLHYWIRTYEVLRDKDSLTVGRMYCGIAYNLCAIGENERAKKYYDKAISLFYEIRRPEDIAEVQYNMALNCIMCGEYYEAEGYLTWCIKAVEKLHLNSLRVCNLSKLYGLLALVTILQGKHFHCERYLDNCRQFLNYVLERERLGDEIGAVHDYANVDDDMFLYTFSKALLSHFDGKEELSEELFEEAEKYLKRAEGNQFFSQALFYKSRMECFRAQGKENRCKEEAAVLREYEKKQQGIFRTMMEELIAKLPPVEETAEVVSMAQLDELLWRESMLLAYKSKRRQLDFIPTWQNLIDVTEVSPKEMLDAVMKKFLNHFNVDCAVYVRYIEQMPQVLFNNTGKDLAAETLGQLEKSLKQNTGGFVISKISSNYAEHQDITSIFGEDDVCSMVAVPFFNNEKMESFLITYVRMKDNWHSSVNRYMLDRDDLNMYQMLFREVKYSLNRIDAYDKIYEMNTKLYLSAVTDQLTGIYNREGFYRKLDSLLEEFVKGEREAQLGLMFIDLDNFKHYNDTFGHDVGDFILIKMAEIFQELSRDRGFVCRYGGDEFIIVFYTAEKAVLEAHARRIYAMIKDAGGFEKEIAETLGHEVSIDAKQRITCSIGIVAKENIVDEEEINALIKQADDLLYTIKTSTKGMYCI